MEVEARPDLGFIILMIDLATRLAMRDLGRVYNNDAIYQSHTETFEPLLVLD